MKLASILLGLFLCINGFAQNKTDYALEQKILDCFYRSHQANGVDVRKTIKSLETVFVNHKILATRSGSSYIRLIEKIEKGDYPDFTDSGLLSAIDSLGHIPMTVFCKDTASMKFLPEEIENSKLKYVLRIYDSLQVASDVSTAIIAGELLKFITAKDLDHDFYKSLELLVVTNMILMARDLISEEPPMSGVVKEESRSNNSYFILVKKDRISAQGKSITLPELRASVKKFLVETSDQTEIELPIVGKQKTSAGIIFLQKDNDTPSNVYQKVLGELANAYLEIRDSNSLKLFKLKFNALDKQRKDVILELVPQRISED